MAKAKAAIPILFDAVSGAKDALSLLRQEGPRAVIEKYGRKFYDELQQVDDRLRADLDFKLELDKVKKMSPALRAKGLETKKITARDKRIEQEAGKRFDPETGGYEMIDEVPLEFKTGGIASAIMDIQNRKLGSGPMGEGLLELLREQLRKDDERLNVRDFTDVIFDPQDPVDLGIAGVAATGVGLPAAATAKIANSGRKIVRGIGSLLPEANDKAIKNYFKYYLGRELAEAPGLIKEEVQNMADGGVPIRGYAKGGALLNLYKNIFKKDKKKDAPKKDSDVVEAGSGEIASKGSGFLGNTIRYGSLPAAITLGATTSFDGGEELSNLDDLRKLNTQVSSLASNQLATAPEDLSGVKGDNVGKYTLGVLRQMKDDAGNPKYNYDPATGKLTDKDGSRPTFLDYVKGFGSGYLEKVSEDPDFAKKMMAGFSAMTMPKEGPVGFSPLGLSEFTQGYLGADIALEETKSADQQLLEYLQQNPDQMDAYLKGQAAAGGTLAELLGKDKDINALYRGAIQDALDSNPEYAKADLRPSDLELYYLSGDKALERIGRTQIGSIVQAGGTLDLTNVGVRPNAKGRARLGLD
tara:strand:- start:23023 stop:24771 length:1749 start_codon:yes stop_codon:yes gene_type:complete